MIFAKNRQKVEKWLKKAEIGRKWPKVRKSEENGRKRAKRVDPGSSERRNRCPKVRKLVENRCFWFLRNSSKTRSCA